MKKLIILGMVVLFGAASAYAGDGKDDECQRTTDKCGTEAKKPLDGYGDQRSGCKDKDKKDKKRCAGCGKSIKETEDSGKKDDK